MQWMNGQRAQTYVWSKRGVSEWNECETNQELREVNQTQLKWAEAPQGRPWPGVKVWLNERNSAWNGEEERQWMKCKRNERETTVASPIF